MADTVTVEIPRELFEELSTLAKSREESADQLVVEGLRWYVASENEFIAAVEEGMADFEAGRVHSHEEVVAEFERRFGKGR